MKRTLFILAICGLFPLPSMAQKSKRPDVKSEMAPLYGAMIDLWEASADGLKPDDKKVRDTLGLLVEQSERIEEHLSSDKAGFRYLSHTLATDAKEAALLYGLGKYEEAAFIIQNMSADCMACHTQLPGKESEVSAGFKKKIAMFKVGRLQKARLLVATRQFDDALKIFEEVLLDKSFYQGAALDLTAFTDYLTLIVRVSEDYTRATKVLGQVLESQQLPKFVHQDIVIWMKTLAVNSKLAKQEKGLLKTARKVIAEAKTVTLYPMDRGAMVHYLIASSLLLKHLEQKGLGKSELAQVYFLLGTTELLVGRSFWLSKADNYLEAAIMTSPGSKYAREAFEALEHHMILEYSGSAGTNIPELVKAKLERLRQVAYAGKASF